MGFGVNSEPAGLGMLGVNTTALKKQMLWKTSAPGHTTNLPLSIKTASAINHYLHPWLPTITTALYKSLTETMNLLQQIYTGLKSSGEKKPFKHILWKT